VKRARQAASAAFNFAQGRAVSSGESRKQDFPLPRRSTIDRTFVVAWRVRRRWKCRCRRVIRNVE